jgi:uncharacterized protein YbjT (DUF2867 family)
VTHCLVTGASGYIGSRLVAALSRSGRQVTATARNMQKLARFDFPESVPRVELDVADAASCRRAFTAAATAGVGRVDTAYFLVHSIGEGDFSEQDLDSARTFAAAAHEAGVARIVYLGGFVPDDEELSPHLASRAAVGDALSDCGVPLVWLRAAVILGAGSTSFELIRHIADRLTVIPLPTWMDRPVSPIAVSDVLHYLDAAADPAGLVAAGAYDISGGQSPSYASLIRAYADGRGLRRVWVPFPPVGPDVVAAFVSRITPLPKELAADLILSLANSMSATEHRIRSLVPDPDGGLVTVADALRRAVDPATPVGVCATADPLRLTATDPPWAGART